MSAKLYVILGSHACRTGMLMLQHKGTLALLSYRRDLRDEIARRPGVRLIDRVLPEPAAVADRYPSLRATAVS